MAQPQPYYAIEGNDNGLSVVFVHGMGVDHRSLMMLDEAFDGNDSIRRIYLDLPGFGRTPALPENACGLPEMADWLQTVIDGLVGKATPFAMVGNSMGGALVREVLAREPRRVVGMALIAPVVDPQHAGRHVAEHVVANPNPKLTPEKTLGTYAGPVLIVTGKQDQIVGYEDQQALLPHYPNATFVTLDNAGHNAHIDQPEAVITLVREWVAHMAFAPLR
ncbi:MAG: alpha/beta fold hydrolase [Bifidobacterium breve]|nr:alpha/beta fold hydrolase [Bifidobacterium breve]